MYFNNCNSLDELKTEFRKLAMQHHPDHGGDTATMQQINAAYTQAVKNFSRYGKTTKSQAKEQSAYRRTGKTPSHVQAAIEVVSNLPGLTVELVGLWVWVSGDTYPYRETFKANGFKWASKKRMWYFAGIESSGYGQDMDSIRNKYGSETIATMHRLSA